MVLPRGRI